jgi:hypothetical protein
MSGQERMGEPPILSWICLGKNTPRQRAAAPSLAYPVLSGNSPLPLASAFTTPLPPLFWPPMLSSTRHIASRHRVSVLGHNV